VTDLERRARLLDAPAWTPADAAFMVRRARQLVNRAIADGDLASTTVGGQRYVRPDDARAWSATIPRRSRA